MFMGIIIQLPYQHPLTVTCHFYHGFQKNFRLVVNFSNRSLSS